MFTMVRHGGAIPTPVWSRWNGWGHALAHGEHADATMFRVA